MSSAKLIFNADEVQRLRTKISQVSQDTNRLYLQLKGQASGWSGIPMSDHLVKAQVLIEELTVEAEKLEDILRTALKGVQSVQEENKLKANQLGQQFSLVAGMFGCVGSNGTMGRISIPPYAQKAATNLISMLASLTGRDELDNDSMVKRLQNIFHTSGLGTVERMTAQSKLNDIYEARNQIAKAQTAYKVYTEFGNLAQMKAAHQLAEDARKRLESLGVDKVYYEAGKDLSSHFKQPVIKACDYDPSIMTSSVPLTDNESYAFLLRMSTVQGVKGDWAKEQLEQMKPQATIGPYDPLNFVSDQEILNLDDPEVQKRLSMTYWNTLSTEEQNRRIAAVQADYKEANKAIADKNRLLGSGVGNQTLANILVGGSNMMVQGINRTLFGLPEKIVDLISPSPKGYVDPMDNPYGKEAGIILGELGRGYLFRGVGVFGNIASPFVRTTVSGAVTGTVDEIVDIINDFREDGKQSLGEHISAAGINTSIAGVGDLAIKAGSKVLASAMRFVRGKLPDIKFGRVQEAVKAIDELEVKAKVIEEPRVEGTGGANLKNIDDFINGNKKFDEVIEDYAKIYKEQVNSNKPWSWDDTILGGDGLSSAQKRKIKELAVANEHIPEIKVINVDGMRYGFADFAGAGVVEETVQLPEEFWKLSDKEQFKWLDEQIGGARKGMTWHHTEIPGKMELVPFGIHNITPHNGGRTTGMWADAPR